MSHQNLPSESIEDDQLSSHFDFDDSDDDEDPTIPDIFPTISTIFSFSIDPITTVETVEDPEVQKAVREMKEKRYMAYVHNIRSLDTSQPYLIHEIKLIGRGVAKRDEERCIEEDMCTPIFPATYHPGGREPMKTKQTFPFDNCYTYANSGPIKVKVKTEWRTYEDAIVLVQADHARDLGMTRQDLGRQAEMKALREVRVEGEEMTPSEDIEKVVESAVNDVLGLEQGHLDFDDIGVDHSPGTQDEPLPDDNASGHSELAFDMPKIVAMIVADGIPDEYMTAIANISYDISRCEDFAQPAEFFEERRYIEELVRSSKIRAIERARCVDEARYGSFSAHSPSAVLVSDPAGPGKTNARATTASEPEDQTRSSSSDRQSSRGKTKASGNALAGLRAGLRGIIRLVCRL